MTMQWGTAGDFPSTYEDVNVTAFFRVFAEDLVERLSLQPGEALLDVATGTGVVLRTARERVPQLARAVGIDMTPGMLAVARSRAGAGFEWVEGDATELPFGDGEFDVVTCQQGLQFFPDRARALSEMRRVGAGGRIAVACWGPLDAQPGPSALARAAEAEIPDVAGVASAPFSLAGKDLAELVSDAGFADVELVEVQLDARYASAEQLVDGFAKGSPLALVLPTLDQDAAARWRAGAISELRAHEGTDGLTLPMVTSLVTATSP